MSDGAERSPSLIRYKVACPLFSSQRAYSSPEPRIAGMGHGVPPASPTSPNATGVPGPFLLDVGLSSTVHIAGYFGFVDEPSQTEIAAFSVPVRDGIRPNEDRLGSNGNRCRTTRRHTCRPERGKQMSEHVDVIIIGSGTAGLSALREVRKKTDDFLLINDGSWGTTCAAVGCMPSKALVEAANAFHRRLDFEAFGLSGAEAVVADIPAVLARVRRLRDDFVKGPEKVRGNLGPRAIVGRARLLGPDRVAVEGREIAARRIVLATGSRPVVPTNWARFGNRILTTDTLFEQRDLPRRIAVVGLGAIGIEMAQALSRLGLEVTGFDAVKALAGLTDPEVTGALQTALEREFSLQLGAAVDLTEAEGGIAVSGMGGSFTADAILAAMGRRANVDDLGLETLGVELDDRGMPPVDPTTMQIVGLPVYLAGDANGDLALLHEAADEGHIAGQNSAAEHPVHYCRRTQLTIVFSSPGVARVGARLVDLNPGSIAIGRADFARQGRARIVKRNVGLMRLYADKETGWLKGAEMCVPAAEHIAHLLALAIERGLTVHEMLAMPFYHPVLEEGLRSALRDLARQLPQRGASDLSQCPASGFEALD